MVHTLVAFALSRTTGLFGFTETGWEPCPYALLSVVTAGGIARRGYIGASTCTIFSGMTRAYVKKVADPGAGQDIANLHRSINKMLVCRGETQSV